MTYTLLDTIDSPEDIRALEPKQLQQLVDELRAFIIDSVSSTGGHFAANLGTVELTVALHRVYNTPHDRLVWDVGHQAYAHKILTGRRRAMPTLRQKGGLSGFPRREESLYDTFGVGHSSTSISAALGMALAARHQHADRKVAAVIGDGALTAGMAYEALCHAGSIDADLLVILNDNDMSISPNVGAMSNYLTRLLSSPLYTNLRESSKDLLKRLPPVWEVAQRTREHLRGMLIPGTLFEEMGFHYFGPIDGHDVHLLTQTLENLRGLKGPRLLHIVTRKGKGYTPAEENPVAYHGVSRFDPERGIQPTSGGKPASPTYTQVFGRWLCDMAARDERLTAITPAMREGSGLVEFSEQYPDRYYDVAIAEQHAVTLAAGMACDGLKPVVAIYSTFLQRGYDQLIHDVALQNLPVLFAIDRAGVVGPDGATHAGSFDMSFMRCLPNMLIMAPSDENECRQMLYTGFIHEGPAAVRYPRGKGPGAIIEEEMRALPIGKAEIVRRGHEAALLCFGAPLAGARIAADALDTTLVNMRFVKPLDEDLILEMAASHRLLVTIEDNAIAGGAGSGVNELLARHGLQVEILNLGLPDRFLEHASREELLQEAGLDAESIRARVAARLADSGKIVQHRRVRQ